MCEPTVVVNRKWEAFKILEVAGTRTVINIGRPSVFGNPYTVEEYGREPALMMYSEWLRMEIGNNSTFRQKVKDLHGKALACWCAPLPCHGDLLAAAAAELVEEDKPRSDEWREIK